MLRQFVEAVGAHQQPRQHLARQRGFRIDLGPQARRLQRRLHVAPMQGHLGGAPGVARIAGAAGEIEIGRDRQAEVAALAGDLGQQRLVEDLPGQLLLGQRLGARRRLRRRGRRGVGVTLSRRLGAGRQQQGCRQRGKGDLETGAGNHVGDVGDVGVGAVGWSVESLFAEHVRGF
jgi:hypothetical protein